MYTTNEKQAAVSFNTTSRVCLIEKEMDVLSALIQSNDHDVERQLLREYCCELFHVYLLSIQDIKYVYDEFETSVNTIITIVDDGYVVTGNMEPPKLYEHDKGFILYLSGQDDMTVRHVEMDLEMEYDTLHSEIIALNKVMERLLSRLISIQTTHPKYASDLTCNLEYIQALKDIMVEETSGGCSY